MSSKILTNLVRFVIIAVAICGIIACSYVLPRLGLNMAKIKSDYAYTFVPWLVFLLITAIPCFIILVLGWKITSAIKRECIFTLPTARLFKLCAIVLLCDAGFFFLGNTIFLALNMSHLAIFCVSLFLVIIALFFAVLSAVLSHYFAKAAALQEEVEGTI